MKQDTYTQIYRRIAADAASGSTGLVECEKRSMAATVVAIWFTVVLLGFGSHVLPLFASVR